ncbi:cell division protein [Bacillus salitolerans]|uniref:Cell division protein n=1 Tax=Bacillus salitolerans TaxID=1437434 RepID=A0ABW4LU54_9BACI
MPIIIHRQMINAPIDLCFNLARNVDIHTKTTEKTREKAVSGVTEGLLEVGDIVTWEATHFGIRQRLTAKVTFMVKPYKFIDVMLKGAFDSFTHTHEFKEVDGCTIMTDTFNYKSPLGPIGIIADKIFLERYMRKFIIDRALQLKKIAESVR